MHFIRFAGSFLVGALLLACGDDSSSATPDGQDGADALAEVTADTSNDAIPSDTAGTPCDPVLQTGCGENQNCTYVAAATTPSCLASGPVPANNVCSTEDRCERGVCMSLNATADYCYQVCGADGDCGAGTANLCLTLTGAAFKVCKIPGIYEACDLLTQGCSDPTKACYAVSGEPAPICLNQGTGLAGAECTTAASCLKGHACVNDVCRAMCDLAVADSCGATATCRDFFENTGYCAPN